jgi:class 3 adenylate cyclase
MKQNPDSIEKKIQLAHKRFVFSRFRNHLVLLVSPIFVLFGLVDYLYKPELFHQWLLYRIFFLLVVVLCYFNLHKNFLKQRIMFLSSFFIVLAANIVNVMIYQSGGIASIYTTGVILCTVAGLQLFKFNRYSSSVIQVFCYGPTVILLMTSYQKNQINIAIIQSLFLICMILLSYVYGASDDKNVEFLARMREKMRSEIVKLNKTERLKKFFPSIIRKQIEDNPDSIERKRKIDNLIVGFADMTNSTKIANMVNLELDWELKEQFLEAATNLALKNDLVVLTHIGDGFLFLANYVNEEEWQNNTIGFFRELVQSYEKIFSNIIGQSGQVESGIKFGLARGEVILGFLGLDQSYFTAIGPAVNLAARICAVANNNELVVTRDLWNDLSGLIGEFHLHENFFAELKGFNGQIELYRISKKFSVEQLLVDPQCEQCKVSLRLTNNSDGYLDYICPFCDSVKKIA